MGRCSATMALTLATPGPVAGMALVLAYRGCPVVYDSPAMIVHGRDAPSTAVRPADPLAVPAIVPPRLSRCGRARRAMVRGGRCSAWCLPLVAPAAAGGLGDRACARARRAAGDQPGRSIRPASSRCRCSSGACCTRASRATSSGVALIMLIVIAAAGLVAAVALGWLRARRVGWVQPTACQRVSRWVSPTLLLVAFLRLLAGEHRLDGLVELVVQVRPAADEEAGDVAVAADDDRLGDRDGLVLARRRRRRGRGRPSRAASGAPAWP